MFIKAQGLFKCIRFLLGAADFSFAVLFSYQTFKRRLCRKHFANGVVSGQIFSSVSQNDFPRLTMDYTLSLGIYSGSYISKFLHNEPTSSLAYYKVMLSMQRFNRSRNNRCMCCPYFCVFRLHVCYIYLMRILTFWTFKLRRVTRILTCSVILICNITTASTTAVALSNFCKDVIECFIYLYANQPLSPRRRLFPFICSSFITRGHNQAKRQRIFKKHCGVRCSHCTWLFLATDK